MIDEPVEPNDFITPKDLIEAIDQKFETLKGKEDRLSLNWGHFSRGMNLQIREYTKKLPIESQLRERYLYVQMYWTSRSRLLDLHMKNKIVAQGKIRRENKLAKNIRSMILSGKYLRPTAEDDRISNFLKRI